MVLLSLVIDASSRLHLCLAVRLRCFCLGDGPPVVIILNELTLFQKLRVGVAQPWCTMLNHTKARVGVSRKNSQKRARERARRFCPFFFSEPKQQGGRYIPYSGHFRDEFQRLRSSISGTRKIPYPVIGGTLILPVTLLLKLPQHTTTSSRTTLCKRKNEARPSPHAETVPHFCSCGEPPREVRSSGSTLSCTSSRRQRLLVGAFRRRGRNE